MPRGRRLAPSVLEIRDSAFSSLAHRLANHPGPVCPLHVGDTWLEPPAGCRMEDLRAADHPGLHRYAPPQGIPALVDAIVERVRASTGADLDRAGVLVTAGATGGLGAVAGAILDPGDEVLVLAPHWPLIDGIVRACRGVPVLVPFLGEATTRESAVELVRCRATPRTAALYLSSPNNPTGRVIPRDWLEGLAEWARHEDLWIIADEVYEDYVYTGAHTPCRALAPERTFAVHSFSKAFGMAGNRCGYVVGPEAAMAGVRKVSTHAVYSTPTASQVAGLRALDGRGDAWVIEARRLYLEQGAAAAHRLGIAPPEGSTFLFLDVASALDARGLQGFLADCADRGLFLAPGPSFGPYPTHVRLCYTCSPPAVVQAGVAILASVLKGDSYR